MQPGCVTVMMSAYNAELYVGASVDLTPLSRRRIGDNYVVVTHDHYLSIDCGKTGNPPRGVRQFFAETLGDD